MRRRPLALAVLTAAAVLAASPTPAAAAERDPAGLSCKILDDGGDTAKNLYAACTGAADAGAWLAAHLAHGLRSAA
ncbi:hypothetical protein BIV57_07725 [Mangrovactinospora gilvigrisea]|uniref:Secreted protein n=1 Tax=Mangrovactinospora gilvigrisea TaxID=1428644 RepID=A0A1J7BH83_9ACTN|nr:hypothetical protein BIV57_07725 [Mangrovactinospora gilvigrisea]